MPTGRVEHSPRKISATHHLDDLKVRQPTPDETDAKLRAIFGTGVRRIELGGTLWDVNIPDDGAITFTFISTSATQDGTAIPPELLAAINTIFMLMAPSTRTDSV
jgi:hypothetical protein